MTQAATMSLLAQLPTPTIYIDPFKVVPFILLFLGWAAAVSWVDKDTNVVKTKREQWNMIVMFAGVVGALFFLLAPWEGPLYFVGIGLYVLLAFGALLVYVIHRNGRVVPHARVLTADHFKRLLTGDKSDKRAYEPKGVRVRLKDFENKAIELADDPEAVADHDAFQDFMYDLLWRRASDAEMLVTAEQCRIVYRVDGVAAVRADAPALDVAERVLRHIKWLAGLNVEERRKPQTGRFRAALLAKEGPLAAIEATTSGSTEGERLRVQVRGETQIMRLDAVGFHPKRLEQLKEILARKHGLFIVSGPSASGVTTTLYSIAREHDAYLNNIHTMEKQPMGEIDNITQNRFDPAKADVSYARQLQSVLRREPEIVAIGECEDRDTAHVATRSHAERKLYLAMEGGDCFEVLDRYLHFLDNPALASAALLGICNQRLVRKLCTECREAFRPDPATLKKLNLPSGKVDRLYRPPTEPMLDKKGNVIICQNCQGSAFQGRIGVFELLVVDDAIRSLIAEGASLDKIKAVARRNRMYLLQEEGLFKVMDGTTSMSEILRILTVKKPMKVAS